MLPKGIDESSDYSVSAVKELVNAGYLDAVDVCSDDGNAFLEPLTPLRRRGYLKGCKAGACLDFGVMRSVIGGLFFF
jgi:hypothetical protein